MGRPSCHSSPRTRPSLSGGDEGAGAMAREGEAGGERIPPGQCMVQRPEHNPKPLNARLFFGSDHFIPRP